MHKIINKFNENDLHILWISWFISVFIDFIKSSHFCPKFELSYFVNILNNHF